MFNTTYKVVNKRRKMKEKKHKGHKMTEKINIKFNPKTTDSVEAVVTTHAEGVNTYTFFGPLINLFDMSSKDHIKSIKKTGVYEANTADALRVFDEYKTKLMK